MTLEDACRIARVLDRASEMSIFTIGRPGDFWRVLRIERVMAPSASAANGMGEAWGLLMSNAATGEYARTSDARDMDHWPPRIVPLPPVEGAPQ